MLAAIASMPSAALAQAPTDAPLGAIAAERQTQLIRMVRQDCGSCHGIQLTGGLGPALTKKSMADMPLDSLISVIYSGRPGTPMPGWKTMINESEAAWIAQQLQTGFPLEKGSP